MARLTIGVVSPGAMGSAVGAAYAAGGAHVVATVDARSERTRRLADAAGLELLPRLDDVVRSADVILSIVPPEAALGVAGDVGAAAKRVDADPLYADLNAIAPATARELASRLAGVGIDVVDGSISGGPPAAGTSTRLYLSGARAGALAGLRSPGLDARIVSDTVGSASAVKMSTASVYKGTSALLAHALLAAEANGVLAHVLDDLRDGAPELVERVAVRLARSVTKAPRYVGEMREIAAAQAAAALERRLFDGFAEAYAALAETSLAREAPESIAADVALRDVLAALRRA